MAADDFASLHRAAQHSLNQGRFAEARAACRRLMDMDPRHADARFLMGVAEDGLGAAAEAIAHLQAAVALGPTAEYYAQLGRLLSKTKRTAEALAAADQGAALEPTDALTIDTLGNVYSRAGRHDKAVALFARAAARQPRQPQFLFNLASSLGFVGRFAEAEETYERLIAVAPRFVKAHTALSGLRRQTRDSNHVARLDSLLRDTPDPAAQIHIRYALAKEHEDLGAYDAAFAHLDAAGRQRKAQLGYTVDFDHAVFDALKRRFPGPQAVRQGGHPSPAPIFVVGMPRTGTTLVDRIISSHPDVTSAGELPTLPLAVKRLSGTASRFVLDAGTIAASAGIDPAALGRRYVEDAAAYYGDTPRFVDKMPLNFLNIGFIAEALPEARVVCLRRNPMDTCWSNFKHLFATDFSYYNYSYDLLDTAAYYLLFDDLMAHWAKVLPGRVLEVSYEGLVADFEPGVRRILAHLGLPWAEACLNFHENAAAVATPSAVQVRAPINAGAVGRWRRYETHLKPVMEFFAARGVAVA